MKVFRDRLGRDWKLSVTVGTIKRVRDLCGVNLYQIIEIGKTGELDMSLIDRLSGDPVLLVDVLYAVCKPDADARGVSDESFAEGIIGDAIEDAVNALLDEITDFFPEAKRRALQKALQATRRFADATKKKLEAVLSDPDLDRRLDSALEKLNDSSGNSPGSSESTPSR